MTLIRGNNSQPPSDINKDAEFELQKKQIDDHLKYNMEKIRMKSEFLVMDVTAQKLIDIPDDSISDYCKLLRTLYLESLTNMHNCNHAIFDEIDKLN